MPINPQIPLQVNSGIDLSPGLNALATAFQFRKNEEERKKKEAERLKDKEELAKDRAQERELRGVQIANEKFKQFDEREQRRLKSTILMGAELDGYLQSGDLEGALGMLESRRKIIEKAKTIIPTLDPNETDEMIELIKSGQIDKLKVIIKNAIRMGQQLKILEAPEKTKSFSPVYDAQGRIVAQQDNSSGEVKTDPRASKLLSPEELAQQKDIRAAGKSDVKVSVDTVENSFAKEFGKTNASQFFERRKAAQDAAMTLESTKAARKLLDDGVRTGSLANFRQGFGKLLQQFAPGDYGKDLNANTDAYTAEAAKRVAMIIKAFGSGTGLSDADREYAQKAAAGQIEITEQGLRRILDMNDKASRNVIKIYNKDAETIDPSMSPYPLQVQAPEETPAGPAEGATATNPRTGKKIIYRGGKWQPL